MNPPPFLVSFPNKASFKAALAPQVVASYWGDIEQLIERRLPPAVSVRVVACLFGFSPRFVGALNRMPERYYRTFVIRKGAKRREIHAPKVGLKVIQKWISWHLAQALNFDDAIYGFVPSRSAPMAAAVHCGAEWVYSVDIADFFPTTAAVKVISALRDIGYSEHAASFISAICCYRCNLAQGSPASPILSNLVLRPYDVRLKSIAADADARFTRYADDIVLSGVGTPPDGLEERVRAVIRGGGWRVAEGKDRLTRLPQRLKVHGLLVRGQAPRLTKGYRNRIRAYRHLLDRSRVNEKDLARFRGHLSYADSVTKIGEQ